jgi:hypothetical protein
VPEAVDAVILRALARSSSRRFMTLRQFLNDVERVAAGEEPMTTSSVMGQLIPARGKNKPKKLAQTMLGGFHAAQDAARARQAEGADGADGEGDEAATAGAADSTAAASAATADAATAASAASESAGDAAEPRAAAGASEATDLSAAGAAGAAAEAAAASSMLAHDDGVAEGRKDEAETPAEPLAAAADAAPETGGEGQVAEAAGASPSTGKFRETKWFKEGVAAEASALLEASQSAAKGVTKGDTGQYSLQTGATKVMASVRNAKADSDDVSSRELIKEMKTGRGKMVAVLVVVLVLVALLIAFAVTR